ncbi:MAG: conjugal transfer protein TraX [Pseudobutyrivibrio sp.]|nr:conjugal transfer protein TraX [Pseudobutyrivibrio sp.]
MENNRREVTGTGLKLLAVITMFIDHLAVTADVFGFLYKFPTCEDLYINQATIYWIMRGIGRLAFPIYCYLLVEGFFHSKNLLKYGLRLLAVAIISEIPFNLVSTRQLFIFETNNVLWELLLGLIVLFGIDSIKKYKEPFLESTRATQVAKVLAMAVVTALGMVISQVTHLDYSHSGIACIVVIYLTHCSADKVKQLRGFIYGVICLTAISSTLEIVALLDIVPLRNYQGHRGWDNKALRWFFYLFYPVHLSVLYIVAQIIIN